MAEPNYDALKQELGKSAYAGLTDAAAATKLNTDVWTIPRRGTRLTEADVLDCLLYTSPSPRDS